MIAPWWLIVIQHIIWGQKNKVKNVSNFRHECVLCVFRFFTGCHWWHISHTLNTLKLQCNRRIVFHSSYFISHTHTNVFFYVDHLSPVILDNQLQKPNCGPGVSLVDIRRLRLSSVRLIQGSSLSVRIRSENHFICFAQIAIALDDSTVCTVQRPVSLDTPSGWGKKRPKNTN